MSEQALFERNRPRIELAEAQAIVRRCYGVDAELQALSSERDLRFLCRSDAETMVLTICNAGVGEDIVAMQIAALHHLHNYDAAIPVPQPVADIEGRFFQRIDSGDQSHLVHAVTYLPGVSARDLQYGRETWRAIGRTVATLNEALTSFHHPAAGNNVHLYDIGNCLQLAPLAAYLGSNRGLVEPVFERYATQVRTQLARLRHQIVHQNIHTGNVLLDPDSPDLVTGIVNFGDLSHAPIIADVAAACDVVDADDALAVMCDAAAGFDTVFPLQEDEIDILFDVVTVRVAMLATINAARDEDSSACIATLKQLHTLGRDHCVRELRRACRFPAPCLNESAFDANDDELLHKRYRLMGEKTTHFYSRPMHFERASGVYLHSTDGKRYLDCYNNVPQVGHCNPHVVRAISRQAATLNTNTRYLYSSALEYAERLTDRLAPHLDACLFVNSGSEANDVAWQMARTITGNSGALIIEDAYHGITLPIRQFSPGHPDVTLPDYLQGLLAPDPYRGPHRGNGPDIAERYAADADRGIAALSKNGHDLAAFMIDSAFCSSGVPDVPVGYLQRVESRVRAAGGLMICDEVQSGFGRMGQWWGHEHHGVTADIVTLGKPVGNGHPLGVVVTSQEILNRFIDSVRLFSTFGGNTVACAAGNAVLDVIERDNLIEHGRATGQYLRQSLRELATTQPLIGDVRGHGMLAGLEFVLDRETRQPATQAMEKLLELMRERQVLVGSEGRDKNILKLRPSLVFERGHVDEFVAALDDSLSALSR